MVRELAIVLVSVGLLAGCPRVQRDDTITDPNAKTNPARDPRGDRQAIGDTITAYVDALAARDPAAAASWVAPSTFGFYERLRVLALTGTREELERTTLMEIVMVLELRTRFSRTQLEQTEGRALFDDAVRDGMEAESVPLDDVWVAEDRSRAEVRLDGQAVLWLRREQTRWVIDLPAMIVGLAPLVEADLSEAILADGKLRVGYTLLEVQREGPNGLDLAILDGPLDTVE